MYNDCRPKRLSIRAHLAVNELDTRSRRAKGPVVRSPWQAIWLLAQALTAAPCAAVSGYTVTWSRPIARRDNQQGPAGLGGRRHRRPGATGLLSMAQRAALAAALQRPPPDGGVWRGPKAAAWMTATLGRGVYAQRGGEALRRLGWTPTVPRPRHAKADPAAQAAFKTPSRPSCPPCSRPTPRRRWRGGRPTGAAPGCSRSCAVAGARADGARARGGSTAISGAAATPLCRRRQLDPGGCCSPPCPLPPLWSPSASLPQRPAPGQANSSASSWIARDGM